MLTVGCGMIKKSFRPYLILAAASILLLFFQLGSTSLYILDEVKNATCALEMKERGDWIVPTFNNELRTDKPVLHYYFMRIGYSLFGANAWGARFFSAFFGVMLILLSYHFTAKLTDKKTAWYQSLILLASLQFVVQFRLAVPDPYLIVWLYLTFIFLYTGLEEQKQVMLAYVFAALGFLTKGLITIVLPGIVMFVYLLWTKRFTLTTLKTLRIPQGVLVFLIITLPWYIAVGVQTNGEWLSGFFLKHNLERYTSTMEGHHGFFLLPFLMLFVALLPYSLFTFPAVKKVFKVEANLFIRYALTIVVVVGVFFSFSKTMLPTYVGPAIPFLSLILAYHIRRIKAGRRRKINTQIIYLLFFITICIPIGAFLALEEQAQLKQYAYLAAFLLPLTIGSGIAIYFWHRRNKNAVILSTTIAWGFTGILFFSIIWPTLYAENPIQKSRDTWKQYDRVVAYKQFNPAFVWSMGKTIPVYHDLTSLQNALSNEKTKVLILSRARYAEELLQLKKTTLVFEQQDLFETSKTILIDVQKN
ncbi:MAG: glycosyltransferase family 39 protein [Cytophagia bacterium]|nr:glycosyltransferase family 39 protein [Cytophagia bacterium]